MPSDAASPSINWAQSGKISKLVLPSGATTSSEGLTDRTLWLFLDESGNFDFKETGTKYFIMTCLATRRPFSICHDLMNAKYDFFEQGETMKKFHATEDSIKVRSAVYEIIGRHEDSLAAYSVYVSKEDLPDEMKSAGMLYQRVFEWITSEVLLKEVGESTRRVIVVTDDIPKEAKKKQVEKPLKVLLKSFTKRTGIETHLAHFPSESDFNLQVADYLCWAFMRKWSAGNDWPYSKVEGIFAETGCLES